MRNPLSYAKNLIAAGALKLRYGSRLTIGAVQTFEQVRVQIRNGGTLRIGCFNQNREKLYLGVDGGELSMGSHCFFNSNASITCMGTVEIGDYCKFGNNLVIVDHDHNTKAMQPEFLVGTITIGSHVWVGANVVILKDTKIGDHCVIAAGSVVKGIIPEGTRFLQKRETVMTSLSQSEKN